MSVWSQLTCNVLQLERTIPAGRPLDGWPDRHNTATVRARGRITTLWWEKDMHANQPLGLLAHAVIEQFGELATDAVGTAVERRRTRSADAVGGKRVLGHVFTDAELADQPLQPGNWIAVGAVRDGRTTTLVEINLGTWEAREIATTA
jgi:hypothetical protein